MDFGVNIKDLSDTDLVRYKDYVFDLLIGVLQSEKRRITLLNRIDVVSEEEEARHDYNQQGTIKEPRGESQHNPTAGTQRTVQRDAVQFQ